MKKPNQWKTTFNKLSIARKAVILALLVISLLAAWKIPTYMDSRKFDDIEEKKSVIVTGLSAYLGENVMFQKDKDECFDTGQGPYDDGYLWCQTSTVFSLKQDIKAQELGDEFLSVGAQIGKGGVASGYELPLYNIQLPNGPRCYLGMELSSGEEINGARKNPLDGNSKKPSVAVTCGDRAKARHYPFV